MYLDKNFLTIYLLSLLPVHFIFHATSCCGFTYCFLSAPPPLPLSPLLCARRACRCRMNGKREQEGLVGAAGPGNVTQAAGLHSGMSVLCASVGTAWSAAAHCASSAAIPRALCSPAACSDRTECEIQSFSLKNVLKISPHRFANLFCHFTPQSVHSSPFKSLVALREEYQKIEPGPLETWVSQM